MGEVVKLDDFRPCPTANVIVDGVIHHVKVQDIADIEAGKKSIAEFEDPELMGRILAAMAIDAVLFMLDDTE